MSELVVELISTTSNGWEFNVYWWRNVLHFVLHGLTLVKYNKIHGVGKNVLHFFKSGEKRKLLKSLATFTMYEYFVEDLK